MASRHTAPPPRALAAIPLILLPASILLIAMLATPLACAQRPAPAPPSADAVVREPAAPDAPSEPPPHAAQGERALQRAIEADRARLITLIAAGTDEGLPLRENPELLEIAERLPRLEEELRVMQRAQPAGAAEIEPQ